MTCGKKHCANAPSEATKVDPAEVEGRPLCDHPGCDKRVVGTGEQCADGHRQGQGVVTPPVIDELQAELASAQAALAAKDALLRRILQSTAESAVGVVANRVARLAEAGLEIAPTAPVSGAAQAADPEAASLHHPDVQEKLAAFQRVLWGEVQGWKAAYDWEEVATDLGDMAADSYGNCYPPRGSLVGNERMRAVMKALVELLETRRDVAQAARQELEQPPPETPPPDGPRCRNPLCGRLLQPDGNCPRGCRQEGVAATVFGAQAVAFGGQSHLDDYGATWASIDPYRREYVLAPVVRERVDEHLALYEQVAGHEGDLAAVAEERQRRPVLAAYLDAAKVAVADLQALREGLAAYRRCAPPTESDWAALAETLERFGNAATFATWINFGEHTGDPGGDDPVAACAVVRQQWDEGQALQELRCPDCGQRLHGLEAGGLHCAGCGTTYDNETVDTPLPTLDVTPWLNAAERLETKMRTLQEILATRQGYKDHHAALDDLDAALREVETEPYFLGWWLEEAGDKDALREELRYTYADGVWEDLQQDELAIHLAGGTSRQQRAAPLLLLVPTPGELVGLATAGPERPTAADWGATGDDVQYQGRVNLAYQLYSQAVREGLRAGDDRTVAVALTRLGVLARNSALKDTRWPRTLLEQAQTRWQGVSATDLPGAGEAATFVELARLSTAEQSWSQAYAAYTRAIAYLQNAGHQAEAEIRTECAEAAWRLASVLGDSETARVAVNGGPFARRGAIFVGEGEIVGVPEAALNYALFVDRGPRQDTWATVQQSPEVAQRYRAHFEERSPDFFESRTG